MNIMFIERNGNFFYAKEVIQEETAVSFGVYRGKRIPVKDLTNENKKLLWDLTLVRAEE